eukprot:TRINITY_DN58593_c0_g1_i1.p2 TRINITY_DN58593_c0_g1~~TRINITY_DN58593_c0_g1_i1.p2  ORF type:complete len:101 (+),score=9.82 TRINITY_DN58593_c0_g1_i1:2-304(+)
MVKGSAQHGRILREDVDSFKASGRAGKVLAAPATRALARKLGIDINSIVGTGPEGRVTKEDLYNHGQEGTQQTSQTSQVSRSLPTPSGSNQGEYEVYQFN